LSCCHLPFHVGLLVPKLQQSTSSLHWFSCFQATTILLFMVLFLVLSLFILLLMVILLCWSCCYTSSFLWSSCCWSYCHLPLHSHLVIGHAPSPFPFPHLSF
jgi:hypothetical protein